MKNEERWQTILKQNFTHWEKLADFLMLSEEKRQAIDKRPPFILNLPKRLAAKIAKNTLDDPILKQFLPTLQERKKSLSFVNDPTGDGASCKTERLLHKYQGRALLICTSACAMHCRYCFRQNFDYAKGPQAFEKELNLIAQDPSIKELILSGGDPLSLNNAKLNALLKSIDAIPHIKRVRFHTRFPVGIPERIDDEFLAILKEVRSQIWFVIHINHPLEIDLDILLALKKIQLLGIPVLTQTVLLKGINDNFTTLKELCEQLADHGIFPYYLHQLDKVSGGAHFEVPKEDGLKLMAALQSNLSGYAVPKYVCEIPGQPSKTPIA